MQTSTMRRAFLTTVLAVLVSGGLAACARQATPLRYSFDGGGDRLTARAYHWEILPPVKTIDLWIDGTFAGHIFHDVNSCLEHRCGQMTLDLVLTRRGQTIWLLAATGRDNFTWGFEREVTGFVSAQDSGRELEDGRTIGAINYHERPYLGKQPVQVEDSLILLKVQDELVFSGLSSENRPFKTLEIVAIPYSADEKSAVRR